MFFGRFLLVEEYAYIRYLLVGIKIECIKSRAQIHRMYNIPGGRNKEGKAAVKK